MNSQFQKQEIKDVLDKEKELLKIIDQIKNKLLKSIIRDSEREQKATR